jgi:hypothetical protein
VTENNTVETALAACLEQLEHGASDAESREPVTADVIDLLQLAHQIRTLPPVEPDSRWLDASKQRLMARFGVVHARDAGAARGPKA